MSVSATVVVSPITATVSGDTVSASVPAAGGVSATVTGGTGPQGPPGAAGGVLNDLLDVQVSSPADGDLLRYSSSRWTNTNQNDVIFDEGNF